MSETSSKNIQFALIVPPGLEQLALDEFSEKIDDSNEIIKRENGIIEIASEAECMLKASLLLKIPTRILLRIEQFKVRDFPKLFKKISKINWGQWYTEVPETIKVTSSKSRLIHTDKIQKTIIDGIEKYFKGNPPKFKFVEKVSGLPTSTLQVNLVDDIMQLSLDISGTELYTRGRKFIGKAPLRENLAAAFYKFCQITPGEKILDPMAGSGTLAFEALTYEDAQIQKKQAWEGYKIFDKIHKEELVSTSHEPKLVFHVNELDQHTFNALRDNLQEKKSVTFSHGDAFTLENIDEYDVIISNPPWGERVKIKTGKRAFYLKILEKFKGKKVCLILPRDNEIPGDILSKAKILKLKSGGLPIIYACWDL